MVSKFANTNSFTAIHLKSLKYYYLTLIVLMPYTLMFSSIAI